MTHSFPTRRSSDLLTVLKHEIRNVERVSSGSKLDPVGYGPFDERSWAVQIFRASKIGRAHVELQSLMRISYAVFCLKKKKRFNLTRSSNLHLLMLRPLHSYLYYVYCTPFLL